MNFPTPYYQYDLNLLRETLNAIKKASDYEGFQVHYAIKANANPRILQPILKAGLGIDAVSGGEIAVALEQGFKPEKIVFAGVGKTDAEIQMALEQEIGCMNVESEAELRVIIEWAHRLGKRARVALRVNPNIDAHTHKYITTGLNENKFGISLGMLPRVIDLCRETPEVELEGLHFHIGSQITETEPFEMLCDTVNRLQDEYEERGITFKSINVGGGLGIDYADPQANPIPDFQSYFDTFKQRLKLRPGQQVHFELGRSVVAQCGSLITRVLYVKEGENKKFVIVDAGFNDLIRPALYQAHHKIINLSSQAQETEVYDVVGPICESSDVFGEEERLPLTQRGDLLALLSAGAYGEVMASRYNCRELAPSYFEE
ncbi:MAG: diaminopimelate decarboxylase [Bacteroidales bacterium]|nr:diaminopimelate decarboxylase [Bacteroidales bacterium]